MNTTSTNATELSNEDFAFIRRLIGKRVGIQLPEGKRPLVRGRLMRRVRDLGLQSVHEYVSTLHDASQDELKRLTNALTTNLTAFFRESHHFDCLAERVVADATDQRLRIWSSACATGQEPYSIAMTLLRTISRPDTWDMKILATDVDSDVLATARRGAYDREDLDGVPQKGRFFTHDRKRDRAVATQELRNLIRFRELNLLQDWPMRGPFDAIFCRNVLIYFDAPLQQQLIERFVEYLRPGGYLFLGHSESMCGRYGPLKSLGKTAFQKVSR